MTDVSTSSSPSNVAPISYPCWPKDDLPALLERLTSATDLHRTLDGTPCIGLSHAHTPEDDYRSLVRASNHEIATRFPLLFHRIAHTYRSLGHFVVYPADLALPLICLERPIPTELSRQFLCLQTGDLTFATPPGPCVQWHGKPHHTDVVFFS